MNQSANRKETWWEVAVSPTLLWSEHLFTTAEIILNIHSITTDDSLWSNFSVSHWNTEALLFSSAFDLTDEPIRHTDIKQSDIPQGEPYILKKEIPVVVERESDTDFIATFRAGNVSIGAETFRDAVQWLVLEILDTFDALIDSESNLGPDAKRQLGILSDYLAKTDGATR